MKPLSDDTSPLSIHGHEIQHQLQDSITMACAIGYLSMAGVLAFILSF